MTGRGEGGWERTRRCREGLIYRIVSFMDVPVLRDVDLPIKLLGADVISREDPDNAAYSRTPIPKAILFFLPYCRLRRNLHRQEHYDPNGGKKNISMTIRRFRKDQSSRRDVSSFLYTSVRFTLIGLVIRPRSVLKDLSLVPQSIPTSRKVS